MNDEKRLAEIQKMDTFAQAQYSTAQQLQVLMTAAVRLGLYDAADAIQERFPHAGTEGIWQRRDTIAFANKRSGV